MIGRATPPRLALVLSLCAAMLAPGSALGSEFTRTATNTSVTLSATSAPAGTRVKVTATVAPIPDDGRVVLTAWTAQSGGKQVLSKTVRVNATTGKAVWDDDLQFQIGTYWFDAEFQGSAYYAPSTSARSKFTVVAKAYSLAITGPASGAIITASQPTSVGWSISPVDAGAGLIEVLLDGEPVASRRVNWQQTSGTVPIGAVDIGQRKLSVRHWPNDWKYGVQVSTENSVGFTHADMSQARTDFVASFSRTLTVGVTPPLLVDSPMQVEHVRLSNDGDTSGGLLVNGTTMSWQWVVPWTLASGADGWRAVWMQVKPYDGDWTVPVRDRIYLDRGAPSGTFTIDGGATTVGSAWEHTLYEQELQGSVNDLALTAGGAISHVAISNDGKRWAYRSFDGDPAQHTISWLVADSTFGWDRQPGPKTAYVKWRDSAGNWSAPATRDYELLYGAQPATLLVNGSRGYHSGDNAYMSSPNVTLSFDVPRLPPGGIDYVLVSEGDTGKTKKVAWTSGLTIPWSLVDPNYGYTSGDGIKNVYVSLWYAGGTAHASTGVLVFLDRVVPTTTVPVPAFAPNTTVGQPSGGVSAASTSQAIATEIAWTGTDRNEVVGHRLQRKIDTASWAGVSLADATLPKAVQVLNTGPSYRYRSRTTDVAGNVSAWKEGPAFTLRVRQESATSITYGGTWRNVSRADAMGGQLRTTTASGASFKATFTGRGIAWVAPRSAAGGTADVYVDGKLVKTVHLSLSSGYRPRLVVFSMAWKAVGTHTIRVVSKQAGKEVGIDSLLILR
jgi:hypothetical protein